ncbi:hypothetical protein AAU61_00360 [Desulfocarbo indianensis]|nr:hypothetical protein AAU61_00360 [Desulfocarbo indianensis]
MSLSLAMSAARLITVPREKAWSAFLDMMGWDALRREEGPRPVLELCVRPLGRRVRAEAAGLEIDPGRRLSWRGQAWGLSVRRDFIFRGAPKGTLVESREKISGWPLLLLRPFISPRAMGQANQAWLEDLARRAA